MSPAHPPPSQLPVRRSSGTGSWTFLTNHGHVLLAVAMNPDIRVRELARIVGITPRHALLILRDLEEAGYVRRERVGRANHYTVHSSRPFRHPSAAAHQVRELLDIFTANPSAPVAGAHR
jgi:DNA-binding transcriptional ArsR family regulator